MKIKTSNTCNQYPVVSDVIYLDEQQILAGKKDFGYTPQVEAQRRCLVLLSQIIFQQERVTFSRIGNRELGVSPPGSILESHVNYFFMMLMRCGDIEIIAKEKTFNKILGRHISLNWEFAFQCVCSTDRFVEGLNTGDIFGDKE